VDLSKYAALFLAESREHLSSCNQLLLRWEREPDGTEAVSGLFRSVHTVKGMAATMGFGGVADLAHRMESLLDALRQGRMAADPGVFQLLFRAVDALGIAVEAAAAGRRQRAAVEGAQDDRLAPHDGCTVLPARLPWTTSATCSQTAISISAMARAIEPCA